MTNLLALKPHAMLFTMMILLLAWLPGRLAAGYLRRRCEELGVAVPPLRAPRRHSGLWRAGAVLVIMIALGRCCYALLVTPIPTPLNFHLDTLLILLIGFGVLAIILPAVRLKREHALYHGSVARSLIPVYAMAIVLLGCTVYPVLVQREEQLVRRERLIFNVEQPTLASPAEHQLVVKARAELLALIAEYDQ